MTAPGVTARSIARRVLVVAPQPFYEDRGTPIAVRELVTALTAIGLEVDLATFPIGRDVDIAGVRVIRAPNPLGIRRVPIGFSARKLVLDVFLFFTVRRLLRERRYFSVHGVEEGGFTAALLAPRRGVPVVYEMQSSMPEQLAGRRVFRWKPVQRMLRACERWLLRRVDLVTCSAGLAPHVRAQVPSAVVREWSYPVPPAAHNTTQDLAALRRELRIADDARVVVYSGTFEKYQGLDVILDAIPHVSEQVPGTVFVLVGAEPVGAERVARQAERLCLNGSLKVVARRPREEVARYHALADVLLAPRAAGSNLPLKVFHYMAAGRAIVATGVHPGSPLLEDGRALVADHSAASIAQAVTRILRDRALATSLSGRALCYAETALHPERFTDAVRDIVNFIAHARADTAPQPR